MRSTAVLAEHHPTGPWQFAVVRARCSLPPERQKLGQCFVYDPRVDAAVGRIPYAPGGAVVVTDHSVLAHDEPVRRLFLDPVLPVVFSVHHITTLPSFHSLSRGRGSRGSGGEAVDGYVGVATSGGAADVITPGRRGRRRRLLLHAVHAPVAQHANRLVHLVVLFRFPVYPFRFHEHPPWIPVIRFR